MLKLKLKRLFALLRTRVTPRGMQAAQALRRAGDQPTRAKVLAALRNFGDYDLGDYSVKYMPSARRGWESVDLSLINARGGLAR